MGVGEIRGKVGSKESEGCRICLTHCALQRDVGGVSRRRYLILHRSRLFLWKDKRISVKRKSERVISEKVEK